uniref:Secreted protein n=1 Tax=Trichogramma kaykai TaxID=54128 RepID=A0ABD2WV51_9HYME
MRVGSRAVALVCGCSWCCCWCSGMHKGESCECATKTTTVQQQRCCTGRRPVASARGGQRRRVARVVLSSREVKAATCKLKCNIKRLRHMGKIIDAPPPPCPPPV